MPSAESSTIPDKFKKERATNVKHGILDKEKPHTDLEKILGKTREEIGREVAIIGDNFAKDMELAKRYDCLGIHAAYGAATADQIKRINKFAPARIANRNSSSSADAPDNSKIKVVNSPTEILTALFED